jgi:capsular polysaccharide biosynthesis protein
MEEEVDLRGYIGVLLKHWKIIVSITVIAGLVAGLVSFLPSRSYEAKAGVVYMPEYGDSDEEESTLTTAQQTLIALVESNSVASQVVEQLGDRLEPGERGLASLLSKVRVANQGDFIEIKVKDPDPEKAADIANAWAESYVSYVNGLYEAQGPMVQVADLAIVPESPVATHRVQNTVIALVLGLIVGILAAFVVEYFQKTPQKARTIRKKPS